MWLLVKSFKQCLYFYLYKSLPTHKLQNHAQLFAITDVIQFDVIWCANTNWLISVSKCPPFLPSDHSQCPYMVLLLVANYQHVLFASFKIERVHQTCVNHSTIHSIVFDSKWILLLHQQHLAFIVGWQHAFQYTQTDRTVIVWMIQVPWWLNGRKKTIMPVNLNA